MDPYHALVEHIAVLERPGNPGAPGLPGLPARERDARKFDHIALVWACLGGHHDIVARLLELGVVPTPAALVSLAALSRPDVESDAWTERLWRAVERWDGSPELQAAECGLTPPQLDMWETTKAQARPSGLRFAD